jgi:transcription elongation factor Elf1
MHTCNFIIHRCLPTSATQLCLRTINPVSQTRQNLNYNKQTTTHDASNSKSNHPNRTMFLSPTKHQTQQNTIQCTQQVQTKKRSVLAKRFKCPFCANEEVVECKMDFRQAIGSLSCRLCGASYQMPIHHLHEPVDVFSEWLDDCEAAALGKPTGQAAAALAAQEAASNRPEYDISDDDEEIDDIPQKQHLSSSSSKKTSLKGKKKKSSSSPEAGTTNYASLGLDDSDDDSD